MKGITTNEMAGTLTMATIVEDFTPPCKKPRKDLEEPPGKTITSYFSPVSKVVDKVLSPPRSNSIRNYFPKTSINDAHALKENKGSSLNLTCVGSDKKTETCLKSKAHHLTEGKKRERRSNLKRKLKEAKEEDVLDADDDIIDLCREEGHSSFLGSDTAALLAQICSENLKENEGEKQEPTDVGFNVFKTSAKRSVDVNNSIAKKDTRKSQTSENLDPPHVSVEGNVDLKCSEKGSFNNSTARRGLKKPHMFEKGRTSHKVSVEEKVDVKCEKETKQARVKNVKRSGAVVKEDAKEVVQEEGRSTDSTSEIPVDELSNLNDSNVVSFEEFLKSHEETPAKKSVLEAEDLTEDEIQDNESANNNTDTAKTAQEDQEVSPRTLTVYAQVHAVPLTPSSEVKQKYAPKKIASIFLKKREHERGMAEKVNFNIKSSEKAESNHKRKSNVVIEEKELELAVLEISDQTPVKPKCSQAEREEFMKAFRQPVGIKKGSGKQKEYNEKILSQFDSYQEDDDVSKSLEDVADKMDVKTVKGAELNKGNMLQLKGNKLRKKKRPVSNKNVEQTKEPVLKANKLKRGRPVFVKNKGKQWSGRVRTPKTDSKSSSSEFESNEQRTEDLSTPGRLRTRKNNSRASGSEFEFKDNQTSNSVSTPEPENGGPSLRRSLRQQKKTEAHSSTESVNKKYGGKILSPSNVSEEDPVQASTPKMLLRSSTRNCMYKAEMISPPTEMENPIRMRFTRLSPEECRKVREEQEADAFTPKSFKKHRLLRKRSKAKQLIAKARGLQKIKSKSHLETLVPLRRSSRQQALADRKSKEVHTVDADSGSDCKIVSVQQEKKKQKLRCINDVLGKNVDDAKGVKNSGKDRKVAALFFGKKGSKSCTSGPVSIFDENSQAGSESSRDDEQFRARREFLKSGLPESLKRQIMKTAVAVEAYSAACMSFQPVTHVQQKDHDCIMWTLRWPVSSVLHFLKEENSQLKNFTLSGSLREFCVLHTKLPVKDPLVKLSGWRPELSEAVKKSLAEEIQFMNTQFPVTRILQQLCNRSERTALLENKPGSQNSTFSSPLMVSGEENNPGQHCEQIIQDKKHHTKMKKINQELDSAMGKNKALNADDSVIVIDPEDSEQDKRHTRSMKKLKSEVSVRGRLSRRSSRRKNEAVGSFCPGETDKDQNVPPPNNNVKAADDRLYGSEALDTSENSAYEDILWTEKYQPQNSTELIGNAAAVKKLHSWLKEWKRRAEKEQQKNEKKENDKSKDVWSSDDFNDSSSEDEEFLCNTVLITGPTGVGKTAAVYACAKELGFKVFEVNASSQRSGRQILSQLKEATQSHQVSKKGSNAQKPSIFSNFNSSKSPGNINSPRKVTTSPRKPPPSPRGTFQKKGLASPSLAVFFKVASKPKSKQDSDAKSQEKEAKDETKTPLELKEHSSQDKDTKAAVKPEYSEVMCEESSRNSATSLILFEEVDVILEEDAGFLSAVKSFMATTKRPVILTSSDTTFSLLFDGHFEEIRFKTPSLVNVASYLQLLCLAENMRTNVKDLSTLLSINNCDIRQSVLYLQFWARGGGGQLLEKPLPPISAKSEDGSFVSFSMSDSGITSGEQHPKDVPKCDTGCTESFLGIGNFTPPSEDALSFLKSCTITVECWSKWLQLFTAFQEWQLDFVHYNLQRLLPLPVCIVQETPPSVAVPASELVPAPFQKSSCHSVDSSPVKMSRMKRLHQKLEILADSDLFDSDSSSTDAVQCKDDDENSRSEVKQMQENALFQVLPEKKLKTPAEQKCSVLVYQSLETLSEFMDNMSFLDCFLHTQKADKVRGCRSDYNWTCAETKDGLWDESSTEQHDWKSADSWREVRAAVEALSLHKCQSCISHSMETSVSACQALGKDPTEELTLHIPRHKNSALFSGTVTSNSSLAQKRVEVMKNVFCQRTHSGIWNMQAATTEFLPVLRNICRSQQLKERGKTKRRFLHYLEGIHLQLPKATMDALATDFP